MMQSPPADQHEQHELEEHDRGLVYDLDTLDRRRVLKLLGFGGLSAGLFTLIGCGPDGATGSASAAAAATDATGASCALVPEETAGPFPGDGSNGPNILAESGVVRSDIRSSFGSSTTVAEGVPLAIQLDGPGRRMRAAGGRGGLPLALRPGRQLLDVLGGGSRRELPARRPGGRRRRASSHSTASSRPATRAAGRTSTSRCTRASSWRRDEQNKIATSQIALPQDACETVYATAGYEQSVRTLGQVSLASDMVFSDDGGVRQLGTVTGNDGGRLYGRAHGCRRGLILRDPASGIVSVTPSDPAICPIIVICRAEVHGASQPP